MDSDKIKAVIMVISDVETAQNQMVYYSGLNDMWDAYVWNVRALALLDSLLHIYPNLRNTNSQESKDLSKALKVPQTGDMDLVALRGHLEELRVKYYDILKKPLAEFVEKSSEEFADGGRTKADEEMARKVCVEYKPDSEECKDLWFDRIAGLEDAKSKLQVGFIQPLIFPNMFGSRAKGLLLYGPPGTGKTLLIKAAVNELRRQSDCINVLFFAPQGADLKGKYVGETEEKILGMFRGASSLAKKRSKLDGDKGTFTVSIIFIDEIDGVASSGRGESGPMAQIAASSVNTILQVMSGFAEVKNTVLIGATNYPWKLDPAVMRRFTYTIPIDIPNSISEIMEIFDIELFRYYTSFTSYEKLKEIYGPPYGDLKKTEAITKIDKCMSSDKCTYNFKKTWKDLPIVRLFASKIKDNDMKATANALRLQKYSSSDINRLFSTAIKKTAEKAMDDPRFLDVIDLDPIKYSDYILKLKMPTEKTEFDTLDIIKNFIDQTKGLYGQLIDNLIYGPADETGKRTGGIVNKEKQKLYEGLFFRKRIPISSAMQTWDNSSIGSWFKFDYKLPNDMVIWLLENGTIIFHFPKLFPFSLLGLINLKSLDGKALNFVESANLPKMLYSNPVGSITAKKGRTITVEYFDIPIVKFFVQDIFATDGKLDSTFSQSVLPKIEILDEINPSIPEEYIFDTGKFIRYDKITHYFMPRPSKLFNSAYYRFEDGKPNGMLLDYVFSVERVSEQPGVTEYGIIKTIKLDYIKSMIGKEISPEEGALSPEEGALLIQQVVADKTNFESKLNNDILRSSDFFYIASWFISAYTSPTFPPTTLGDSIFYHLFFIDEAFTTEPDLFSKIFAYLFTNDSPEFLRQKTLAEMRKAGKVETPLEQPNTWAAFFGLYNPTKMRIIISNGVSYYELRNMAIKTSPKFVTTNLDIIQDENTVVEICKTYFDKGLDISKRDLKKIDPPKVIYSKRITEKAVETRGCKEIMEKNSKYTLMGIDSLIIRAAMSDAKSTTPPEEYKQFQKYRDTGEVPKEKSS